jgi:putative DNA primase/helicase
MNDDVLSQLRGSRGKKSFPSEDEIATEFINRHGDELRYCQDFRKSWLAFDGSRWCRDPINTARHYARELCREYAEDFSKPKLAGRQTTSAVLYLAECDRHVATEARQWDTDPDILCTPGGIVDLRTGRVRPARPSDYCTRQTAVAPRPGCCRWKQTLEQAFPDRPAIPLFLQRYFGYSLSGHTREHRFLHATGSGGNAKDTVFGPMQAVMGDYARTVPVETLLASKNDRHPTEIALLRGVRFGLASETPKGRRWNEARLKLLTGGGTLSARYMGQDFFDFTPTAKLVIYGNEQPRLSTIDEAWHRRMLLLLFLQTFRGKDEIKGLKDLLIAEEGPGILDWGIEGAVDWYRNGLQPPKEVLTATEAYMVEQDVHGRWIDECLDASNPQAKTHLAKLFTSWATWAEAEKEYVGTRNSLSRELVKRYGEKSKDRDENGVFFTGLKIGQAPKGDRDKQKSSGPSAGSGGRK